MSEGGDNLVVLGLKCGFIPLLLCWEVTRNEPVSVLAGRSGETRQPLQSRFDVGDSAWPQAHRLDWLALPLPRRSGAGRTGVCASNSPSSAARTSCLLSRPTRVFGNLGKADPVRIAKLANYVRRRQLADGGWDIYPGGPSELNATSKAYFALKLAGDSPDAPHMTQARETVHRLGGLERTNSYVRFYLALVGAVGWELVPAIPPELMLLPNWFYINIYEMSSWTRGIVIPMAILSALRPDWRLPERARVDELFKDPAHKDAAFDWSERLISWRNFFLALDRGFKLYEKFPWKPLRQRALKEAKNWMLTHLERSEGLAAIYPAMMNSILALIALGYGPDDPLTAREIREFAKFEIEEAGAIRMQPCVSPVWDTCIAMVALEEAGVPADHPALVKAADWILSKQIMGPGDWQVKNKDAEPGGWAFEFRNDFYPDVDDTAFVLMALQRVERK